MTDSGFGCGCGQFLVCDWDFGSHLSCESGFDCWNWGHQAPLGSHWSCNADSSVTPEFSLWELPDSDQMNSGWGWDERCGSGFGSGWGPEQHCAAAYWGTPPGSSKWLQKWPLKGVGPWATGKRKRERNQSEREEMMSRGRVTCCMPRCWQEKSSQHLSSLHKCWLRLL